jgi:hypothetical protein
MDGLIFGSVAPN